MGDLQKSDGSSLKQIREQVIDRLKNGYAHDLLEETEFERMIEQATNAQTKQELALLAKDVPEVPGTETSGTELSIPINNGPVKQEDVLACVFSGTSRKGMWRPARSIKALTVFGGTDLDFTQAEMPKEGTEIDIFCAFGGVDIAVPEGLNVDASGMALFGGFDDKSDGMVNKHAPVLKIRGFVLFGGVDIKMRGKKRNKRKDR